MATSRRRRVALSGITTAALVAMTTLAGQGTAAAAPAAVSCSWAATASKLLASLDQANDPRAEGIRTQLLRLGFGSAGELPANCVKDAVGGDTPGGGQNSNADGPLQGVARKGLFTDSGATGTVIQVSGGAGAIANADPQPGDTVEIAAGTYSGFTPKSGSDGAYVTYRPAQGANVVINGGGEGQGVINLSGVSFVHLDGLTVTDSPSHGIFGSGANNIALTNMEVAGSGDGGLVILESDTIHIEGCDVHNTNQKGDAAQEGLTIGEDTKNFEVFNCKVHDNGEEGIDTKYEATNGIVHNNAVWGNKGPNIYADAVQNVEISDNWVWGATGSNKAGIMLAVEAEWSRTDKMSDVTVRNNVVWGNAGGENSGIKFWLGPFSGVVVENNIVGGGNSAPTQTEDGIELINNVTRDLPAAAAVESSLGDGTNNSTSTAGDDGRNGGGSSDEEN